MFLQKKKEVFLISAVFSLHFMLYYFWFKNSGFWHFMVNSYPHSFFALDFYRLFFTHNSFVSILGNFFSPAYWPRLHYLFSAISIGFFGRSYISMVMVNTFYLLLLMFSIYGITRELTGNKWCGALSAIMVSLFPGVASFMRTFELQMAVAAFTSLSIYFLIRSKNFTNTLFSVLFSLSWAAAMYTDRVTPMVFIIGPVAYTVYKCFSIKGTERMRRKALWNLLLAFVIFAGLSLTFYATWIATNFYNSKNLHNLFNVTVDNSEQFNNAGTATTDLAFQRWFFYLLMLPYYHLGIFWTAIFLVALLLYIRNSRITLKYLALFWLLVPFLFFTGFPKKDFSYLFPALAPISVITAAGIFCVINRKIRLFLAPVVLVIGFFQYFILLFLPEALNKKFFINFPLKPDNTIAEIERVGKKNIDLMNWFNLDIVPVFPGRGPALIGIDSGGESFSELGIFVLLHNPLFQVNDFSEGFLSKYDWPDYMVVLRHIGNNKPGGMTTAIAPESVGLSAGDPQRYRLLTTKINTELDLTAKILKKE